MGWFSSTVVTWVRVTWVRQILPLQWVLHQMCYSDPKTHSWHRSHSNSRDNQSNQRECYFLLKQTRFGPELIPGERGSVICWFKSQKTCFPPFALQCVEGLLFCKLLGVILHKTRWHSSVGGLPIPKLRVGIFSISPERMPKHPTLPLTRSNRTQRTYWGCTVNLQHILRSFSCSNIL